jgi:diguanylate cyclase (GGDEF)-like protein/PAS domain S-box-containing protein
MGSSGAFDAVPAGVDRQSLEAGLRKRERQFADAQALAHVGSWEREFPAEQAVWSDELCRIFGIPIGSRPTYEEFAALVHPEDLEMVAAYHAELRAGGRAEWGYRIIRPTGELRYVEALAYGRSDEFGSVTHVFGTIQDVTERHEAEVAGREAQELFETAFAYAPTGIALIALDGRWMKVNAAACQITGWAETELLQRNFRDFIHPDDADVDGPNMRALRAGQIKGYRAEKRCLRRSGEQIWVLLSMALVRDPAGAPRHYIAQLEDITQSKRAQRQLQEARAEALAQRDHATAIISAMREGYALTVGGEITAVNTALCTLTGFTAEQLVGSAPPYPFCPPEHREESERLRREMIDHDGGSYELTLMRCSGERFEAEITAQPAHDGAGNTLGFVNTVRDVSVQKRHQRELERLARTDSLTGLANRHVLQAALDREAGRRSSDKGQLALVLLDLDHFKHINDDFGHPSGDAVLIEVARRLEQTVRTGEVLARVGGEEFAWLLPASNEEEAIAAADRARAAISSQPFGRAGTLTMSAGVGLMTTPSDGDTLYRLADRALYEAKQSGRNRTCTQAGGAELTGLPLVLDLTSVGPALDSESTTVAGH